MNVQVSYVEPPDDWDYPWCSCGVLMENHHGEFPRCSYEEYLKEGEETHQRALARRGKTPPHRWGERIDEDHYFCHPCWYMGYDEGHWDGHPPCDPMPRGDY